ncbi:hypothetical protein ABT282_07360 [Streptomyces sp. NPDC000927]|uniref:hypothetical protein n=1 Tax=Streptomyces sp. NPDC000927 TaxID=3154371 RepID=UPI00331D5CE9
MTSYEFKILTYGPEGYIEKTLMVNGPLYHGSRSQDLDSGDELLAGFPTNDWGDEGERSQFIHFTTRLDVAFEYARRAGGFVYEVVPTGGFRMGYSDGEYKTECPMVVVRRVE